MGGTAKYTLPNPPPNEFGFFTHTIRTKANSIKFAHQSMCSPKISTLLKAIRRGFLNGCPNLSAKGVMRYLNLSPATAKGHMKQPHQGIRSTTAKQPRLPPSGRKRPTVQAAPTADEDIWIDDISEPSSHAGQINHGPSVIIEDDDSAVGNIFLFCCICRQAHRSFIQQSHRFVPLHVPRGKYVTSSSTTTNPTQSWVSLYLVLMTTLFLQHTKHSSNFWKAKDTR